MGRSERAPHRGASTIVDNVAERDGGGVWTNASLIVDGTTVIDGNEAKGAMAPDLASVPPENGNGGGGIYNRGGSVVVKGVR